jgi:hypothetical protein
MKRSETSWSDCVAALFSYEFVTGGVDYDTVEAIHRGQVDDWVGALGRSGLFTDDAIAEYSVAWSEQPKLLFDILLRDADEVTARRCRTTWSALDRLAPLTIPIAHSG